MNRDMDKFGLTEKLLHFMVEEVDRMRDVLNDLGEEIEYKDRLLAEKVEIIRMLSAHRNKVTKTLSPKKPAKRKAGRPKGSKTKKLSNNS
jgi:hypothetical protein